ncbi:MAG: shikimate dehydrogenase [SAR86 cluster bacterium]|uniref:Shikimate dehydrogenase (NADP(+)) n=1 Tax=SAR86 cluster bacterium TaxID=2030880 RepID=A0A2A4MSN2_9GAMM|nr:MAG: shikimate dehydrogenase [SAR86 cluster bacterium]
MKKYAVLGNPIEHSKSPEIHRQFAEQTNQQISYTRQKLEVSEFEDYVRDFFNTQGGGLNITVPFKEMAFAMADKCSKRAQMAKAVNTLYLDAEQNIVGDNTDSVGLIRDLRDNHGVKIENKNLLIAGAGGAVRGVLAGLVSERPARVTIVNRTAAKAEQLVTEFKEYLNIDASDYQNLGEAKYDLVINGTSMGLSGETPPLKPSCLAHNCCCYDMMYGNEDTAFVSWAKQQGVVLTLDGLGMLVEQAAESFSIWRGIRPQTDAVLRWLREQS